MTRLEILELLRRKNASRQAVVAGLAHLRNDQTLGIASELDLAVVYHTTRFPGLNPVGGLLPFADANGILLDLTRLGLPKDKPILAGVCGTDPFRLLDKFLNEIEAAGFHGLQNFPSIGFIDGDFRGHLENSKIGYGKEVELIALGHERGLLTMALVFTEDDAVRMTEAGADILVIHSGEQNFSLLDPAEKNVKLVEGIAAVAKKVRKNIFPLVQCPSAAGVDAFLERCWALSGCFVVPI